MSTNDFISIFLSIELQSYGCAPSEVYVAEILETEMSLISSSIFGLPIIGRCSPRVITTRIANNYLGRIADYKKISQMGLPSLEICLSGDSHGQDNELDTYREAQLGLSVLSRISRHLIRGINVCTGRPYCADCQKPLAHFSIENQNTQGPNTINSNANATQPRDLTAYGYNMYLMRGRSFHSSNSLTKGNSRKSSLLDIHGSNIKGADKLNLLEDSKSLTSISSWAKTVVNNYIKGDGTYNGLINILSEPSFLQACYLEIKSKPGNMSKGSDNIILDGINDKWFVKTAGEIRSGKFDWSPARIVMIPKPGKKELRPLSVASPRDKIVQKALAVVLEAIWEDSFSESSFGFRPNKSLHQALYQIYRNGSNYQWVVQGDISKCFDTIPHDIIYDVLSAKITCDKTLQLIRKFLNIGYIDSETKEHVKTDVGTPQGSVLSPLLSNIVLNELDEYMNKLKGRFEKGKKRAINKQYDALTSKIQNLRKTLPGSPEIIKYARLRRELPSMMYNDPNFKLMMYLRYADDFIVLVAGSSDDAHLIRNWIKDVLNKKCGLQLNVDKTIITATKDGFNFLGARCVKPSAIKAGLFTTKSGNPGRYRMRMRVMAPIKDLINKLKVNKFVKIDAQGMPYATARKDLVNFSHYEIITFYNHRIQGLYNFYSFASNLNGLRVIFMFLQFSCVLTLALKLKLRTKKQVFNKFGFTLKDPDTEACLKMPSTLRVRHQFSKSVVSEAENILKVSWFNKLTRSNINKACALCNSTSDVEMHHIRQVKDVKNKIRTGNSTYQQWVGSFYRKQVPLCFYHHDLLHSGDLNYADMTKLRKYT